VVGDTDIDDIDERRRQIVTRCDDVKQTAGVVSRRSGGEGLAATSPRLCSERQVSFDPSSVAKGRLRRAGEAAVDGVAASPTSCSEDRHGVRQRVSGQCNLFCVYLDVL